MENNWKKIDENVNLAGDKIRQANEASRGLHKMNTDGSVSTRAGERLRKAYSESEEALRQEAEDIMGDDNSFEREMARMRKQNLMMALRANNRLDEEMEELQLEEAELLKTPSSSVVADQLKQVREEQLENRKQKQELMKSSPEAWYGLHLGGLKQIKRDLEEGRLVETDYIKDQVTKVVTNIRAGQPVFIYGELGSGKTEMARHAIRKILEPRAEAEYNAWLKDNPGASESDKKAKKTECWEKHVKIEIISGSKDITENAFFGSQVLSTDRVDKEEAERLRQEHLKGVNEDFAAWEKAHPDATDEQRLAAYGTIETGHTATLEARLQGGTVSGFELGPIYRAMKEGRPIILDEVNAIPHTVLISLNDLLTRRPGDKVTVQQSPTAEQIIVQPGFCFVLTGNINKADERYVGRQQLDPAFLSRLQRIEHHYLPQATQGTIEQAHIIENGQKNELFELLMAMVIDRNGNLTIPDGELNNLWILAMATKWTQNNFSGLEKGHLMNGRGEAVDYQLKEGVLSIRGLVSIIEAWQNDRFQYDLDHYVFEAYLNQIIDPRDKILLYDTFQNKFGFFDKDKGWPELKYDLNNLGSINLDSPKHATARPVFMGPLTVVDTLYGKAPEREQYPQGVDKSAIDAAEDADKSAAEQIEFLAKGPEYRQYLDGLVTRLTERYEPVQEKACALP